MQADHHDEMHNERYSEWWEVNGQSLDPNSAVFWPNISITGCPRETRDGIDEAGDHETGDVHPGDPGFETNDLAGECHDGLLDEILDSSGHMTDSRSISSADSKPKTKQVRLRLTEEFAAFLSTQPHRGRGMLFVTIVFGQIPTMHKPVEYIHAVKCLQCLAVLLLFALERELEKQLAADARQVINLINRLTRKRCLNRAYSRLRIPTEYADALPTSLNQREFLVRLALRASTMSIPLPKVVMVTPVLNEFRIRLTEKLGLSPDAKPEVEVRNVVQAVLGIREYGGKGDAK